MAQRVKCPNCKMYYQGFHVCLDLSTPEPPMYARERRNPTRVGPMSDAHRENLAASQRERWQKLWDSQKGRDEEIIALYGQGGHSFGSLAKKYGIGRGTILRILKNAEAEGKITIRRRGVNISKDIA